MPSSLSVWSRCVIFLYVFPVYSCQWANVCVFLNKSSFSVCLFRHNFSETHELVQGPKPKKSLSIVTILASLFVSFWIYNWLKELNGWTAVETQLQWRIKKVHYLTGHLNWLLIICQLPELSRSTDTCSSSSLPSKARLSTPSWPASQPNEQGL